MSSHCDDAIKELKCEGKEASFPQLYSVIDYDKSLKDYCHCRHACHAMIYAEVTDCMYQSFSSLVHMQLRFDGMLGFPGGLVERNEDPIEGLNRELREEVGTAISKYPIKRQDYARSYLDESKNLILHFFIKKVLIKDFLLIEEGVCKCEDFGGEVLGVLRPPLYIMRDGVSGLPAFLTNNFVGNARDELLYGLIKCRLLSEDDVKDALLASKACSSRTEPKLSISS